jgi:hypothetical protein
MGIRLFKGEFLVLLGYILAKVDQLLAGHAFSEWEGK